VAAAPVRVDLPLGVVVGEGLAGVDAYRGLPYAEPPLGALRFRAPRPLRTPWGELDATRFGPSPVQPQGGPLGGLVPGMEVDAVSEDCLTLNVWVPHATASGAAIAGLPVLVWFPGGSFTIGGGAQAVYDGAALARRTGVIVVTCNYRLGVLGFLGLWALDAPPADVDANPGLLDQVAVLTWVRDHIAAFGGNPGAVTIFGESAGGGSVLHLLASPASQGLVTRAICQSGATELTLDREGAKAVAEHVLGLLGIDPADAGRVRDVAASDLLAAQSETAMALLGSVGMMPFHPAIDGAVLPARPRDALRAGSAAGVPLVIGTTADELKLFASFDPSAARLDRGRLLDRVRHLVDPAAADDARDACAEHVVAAYEEGRGGADAAAASSPEIWQAVTTDVQMRLPALDVASAQLAHAPVFAYLFTWPAADPALGSCHAIDLPFTFDTWDAAWTAFCGADERAQRLTHQVQDAWGTFARTGDPSHPGIGTWPRYDEVRRPTMVLGADVELVDDPAGLERAALQAARRGAVPA
jgi:para-nitrobenzyl esterase